MKHIIKPIIWCVVFIAAAYVITGAYFDARNSDGKRMVQDGKRLLEVYRQQHENYPASLTELGETESFTPGKVWGILPGAEVKYIIQDDQYWLYYHMSPFGPFHGFKSKSQKWEYEE